MQLHTTVPVADVAHAGELFRELEDAGYDGAFTYETKHDPFLPLVLAADRTTSLRLGTAVAIAFCRTPLRRALRLSGLRGRRSRLCWSGSAS